MAISVHLLNNSPPNSSDEEFSDSEVSYSSEDEPSESENTNGGSRSSLSSLEHEVEETKRVCDTEDEFWVKYPYLKTLVDTLIAQGFPENYAYERAKLIGDEKAKELNDEGKALFIKELEFCRKKLEFIASVLSLIINSGI